MANRKKVVVLWPMTIQIQLLPSWREDYTNIRANVSEASTFISCNWKEVLEDCGTKFCIFSRISVGIFTKKV